MGEARLSRREAARLSIGALAGVAAAGTAAAAEGGGKAAGGAGGAGTGSIGLAPGARSAFAKHSIDRAFLESLAPFDVPFNPGAKIRGYSAINEPNCQVIVEDFMPGVEFTWVFPHDEFQYCISGEMDLEVWLPPLYSESTKTRIKAGDVYVYPVGARKHVKVVGTEPFRHICFCPPSPNYPFPEYVPPKR
jgi:quercetin dioxygenase-like cupin family protein